MKNYSDLEVWIKCRELVTVIYKCSSNFPHSEMFGLTNQMRRSAVSIPSNIAEGCGRNSSADTLKFLFIARGSLYELETQLYLAFDLTYLDEETIRTCTEKIIVCKRLLSGFINYYQRLKQTD